MNRNSVRYLYCSIKLSFYFFIRFLLSIDVWEKKTFSTPHNLSKRSAVDREEEEEIGCLPKEIVEEILCRCSVTSLMRLRCVCKSWRNLISDALFVNKHLLLSKSKHNILYTFLLDPHLYTLNQFSSRKVPKWDSLFSACTKPIWGSCNGLVCGTYESHLDASVLWLYNPSTRQYREISTVASRPTTDGNPIWLRSVIQFTLFGFGYNATSKDYEIIVIDCCVQQLSERLTCSRGSVYSLRQNTWRTIQLPPSLCCRNNQRGLLFNGLIHWVTYHPTALRQLLDITAFDFATDTFIQLPIPVYNTDYGLWNTRVVSLGGCLGLICRYETFFDTYMMREYGVGNSWTKLLTVDFDAVPLSPGITPESVVLEGHRWQALFLYYPEDGSFKQLDVKGLPRDIISAVTYTESLVTLDTVCEEVEPLED